MDQITVENVYPLNHRQETLLLEAGYAPDAKELTETWNFVLRGELSEAMFGAAWEKVCERHVALRTMLVWKRVETPLQVVQRKTRLPLKYYDWRELTPAQQFAEFVTLVRKESEQGFNAALAPLVRLCLCRTADDTYQVVCSYSPLLFDRRSLISLFKEALETYAQSGNGHDVVVDRINVNDGQYSSARDWWSRTLADFRTSTLIASRSEKAAEEESFYGEAELKLKANLQRTRCTLDTLIRSAWAVVLANYTGEKRVTFGADTESGDETLPLRVDVENSSTVSAWLKKQDAAWAQLSRLATVPTALIRKWGQLDPNMSLFESRLVLQPLEQTNFFGGFSVEQARAFALHETPLIIEILTREPLKLRATFASHLLDSAGAARLLRHFEQVLKQMVTRPEARVGELELVSEAERQQLREWNQTEREYGRERSIAAMFEQQVRERPDAQAVVMGEQSLTYQELNQRANQLGHYLRELGVGPEVCVGLCVERSLEMVVGMLGILKAGGAYVPLDASYPTERLAYMMADAGIVVVLTQEALLDALPLHWAQVVSLDGDWEEIAQRSDADVISDAAGDNLAYVMYTSGSTGEPKGVAVVQRAVVRLVRETDYAEFGPAETFMQMAPLTFDASTFEVWGSLLNGGRLVVLEPGAPTLEELGVALRRYRVSTLWLTAGLFHLLVDERPEEVRGLKQLLAGGDVLSPPHVRKALQWLDGGYVINGYGPTENTTFSCCQRIQREADVGTTVPIGPPIANTQAYVLNRQMQQVAIGVVGELYLGGDGLARGYQQRPDLTAERFIPHPHSETPGARLYRTGDQVRYLEDGRLEFLGRVDHQVKVRGFRIEPGEIETVLTRHRSVRQCVVVARQEGIEKQLVAYIVIDKEQSLTADDVRAYLREHVPDYMVPSQIVFLDAFPLTANGKVDKSALPSPAELADIASQDFVAPRTPVEIALAEVWKRVLGVDRVGIHDNYFDLGGDSIRSIQVRAQAQKAGYDFSVQQIFEHQTIAELAVEAKRIDGRTEQSFKVNAFDLITPEDRARIPADIEDAYPLSLLQRGMLFHSELNRQAAIYHDIIGFHVRTPLDRSALEAALQQVVTRHPVLRTSFDLQHYSEPLQLVHRTVKPQISFTDQRHLSTTERKQFLARWIEEDKQRRFEWTQPAFIRFAVFGYGDDDFYINFSFHHAILDGWSLNLLITEIFSNYVSLRDGSAQTNDAPLSIAFRDFIALERQALQSEETRSYWSEKLAELPVTTLPTREGAAPPDAKREVIQLSFDSKLVEQLKSFAKLARVPLKSVFVAAHMKILGLLSGQAEVTTGLVTNCRPEEADGDRVLGVFLNTLPFTIAAGDQMWVELAQAAAEAEQELSLYRRYPLAELQREHGTQPLFETTFNFNHFHIIQELRDDSPLEIEDVNSFTRTNFPLSVGFELNSITSELVVFLEYDAARLSQEQAEAIGKYFSLTLHEMARDPFAVSGNSYLITESDRQKLLFDLNDTKEDYPREACLHELIEVQAERTPHATALISDDEEFSYRQLNRRANRLAHYLREQGVGPESLVGVLLERSNDLIVALLAVLKAGGAYVPLDPAYPRERLQLMLEDAGISLLLTERKLHDRLPSHNALITSIDDESTHEALNSVSSQNPKPVSSADNLIYLLYTSGSTGVPKGVLVTHRGIVNCMAWMQRTYDLNASDRFLFKTSLNFDASVWEVFWPLTIGAAVVVARTGGEHDGPYLVETMRREDVTCAYFVPSMLTLWLETPGIEQLRVLRYMICGGEALSGQLLTTFFERLGERVELHHSYGPTETSIASAESVCSQSYRTWRRMPMGRALANTKLYVVDASLQLVPLGIAGELCVGGDGVARGYLHRPELTATAFIPDPFSTEPGARLYRTGDLVRYLHDGQLEFLGRVDDQVKLRGVRIELGEIEATLRRHSDVREAVAVVREFAVGDPRLVAYVVSNNGVDQTALREYLRGKLPEYLLPSAFVLLEKLPLLPSGKVNRKALPAPEITRQAVAEAYGAPRNAMEEIIAAIWSELLGVKRVGVYDNFFELGGHSLLAAQIIVRVRDKFAVDVPLESLFDSPNVAGMTVAVMQSQSQMLDLSETKDVLAELQALSEEEAQSLVAGHGGRS
ncbi:MAG TPA: amino acid adenylation domain-containing protein [Pyrinomonadaceae bacterium]